MDEIIKLTNKLIKKSIKINSSRIFITREQKKLYYFFELCEIENVCKLSDSFKIEIKKYFKKHIKFSLESGGSSMDLLEQDMVNIYTSFFINTFLSNITFKSEVMHNFFMIDDILNRIIDYETNFFIFYYNKNFSNTEEFKKNILKILFSLVEKEKIDENKIIENLKTVIYLSIGEIDITKINKNRLKYSFSPYEIRIIEGVNYLIGDTFLDTTEIFRKNSYSNRKIKLINNEYLSKLLSRFVYIDKEDFMRVKKIHLTAHSISFDSIVSEIEKISNDKKNLIKEIKNIRFSISETSNFEIEVLKDEIKNYFKMPLTEENILLFVYNYLISDILNIDFKENNIIKYLQKNFSNEQINNFIITNSPKIIEKIKNNLESSYYNENNDKILLNNLINKLTKKITNIFISFNNSNELKKFYLLKYSLIKEKSDLVLKYTRRLSLLYTMYIFNEIEQEDNIFDNKIFIPFFFDFRSRKYDDSIFGVTGFVASRYFMNYGYYTIKSKKTNYTQFIIKSYWLYIDKIKKFLKIKSDQEHIKEAIFWCLIAIGKEFIIKNKDYFKTEDFLKTAIEILEKDNVYEKDLEKKLVYTHYKTILLSLNEKGIKKRFIHKDATASFIQNLIRILGAKNIEALEKSNLKSNDTWYDTYTFCLNEWKKKLKIQNNMIILEDEKIDINFLEYFIRKTIKLPIMTATYDSTYKTRLDYFKNSIKENFEIKLIPKEVITLFKNFYDFVENSFWDDTYLDKKSDTLLNIINKNELNNKFIVKSKVVEADLIYFKSKTMKKNIVFRIKDNDSIINIKRRTKEIYMIDEEKIYIRKMKQAIKANRVHFSDASLCIQINNKITIPYLTIHDCFLVDVFSVSYFIEISNEAFKEIDNIYLGENKEIFSKVNSIYIFI